MSIVRSKRKANFSIIDNEVYKANVLTWEAMGMLSHILSKPDGWKVLVNALVKTTEGTRKNTRRTGVYGILRELKTAGFVQMIKYPCGDVDYIVFDSPQKPDVEKPDVEKPDVEKPDVEKPDVEKPHALVSTDSLASTDREESTDRRGKPPKPDEFADIKAEYNLTDMFVGEILKHRREIKSRKPTPKAMKLIIKGMVATVHAGIMPNLDSCLAYYTEETTWQGFKPEFFDNRKAKKQQVRNQSEDEFKKTLDEVFRGGSDNSLRLNHG